MRPPPEHWLFCRTFLGRIAVAEEHGAIVRLYLPGTAPETVQSPYSGPDVDADADRPPSPVTPLLEKVRRELAEYFAGVRKDFDLPLAPTGTVFQRKIWTELRRIPWGACITYGELAARAGCGHGARAAGQAVHRNPIAILIPCHRVIASGGRLGGFASGPALKSKLLALEGVKLTRR